MDVSKNRGNYKMDGLFHGSKPYEQMDDLVGFPIIFGLTPIFESDENLISDKTPAQVVKSLTGPRPLVLVLGKKRFGSEGIENSFRIGS